MEKIEALFYKYRHTYIYEECKIHLLLLEESIPDKDYFYRILEETLIIAMQENKQFTSTENLLECFEKTKYDLDKDDEFTYLNN